MNFRVDPYLQKTLQPTKYNCWHFVQEIWKDLTGIDLGDQTPENHSAESYKKTAVAFAATLEKVPHLQDPCIVLMLRERVQPHIGVYYNGRLLHLNARGAEYRPIDQVTASYTTVQYYK